MSTISYIVQWGITLFFMVVTFSPFFIILHKKFRPTKWYHILGTFFCVYLIYSGLLYLMDPIDNIFNANSKYLYSIGIYPTIGWYSIFSARAFVFFTWPLFIFYSIRLLKIKLTFLNVLISLIIIGVLYWVVWQIFLYEAQVGLQEFAKYLNKTF